MSSSEESHLRSGPYSDTVSSFDPKGFQFRSLRSNHWVHRGAGVVRPVGDQRP